MKIAHNQTSGQYSVLIMMASVRTTYLGRVLVQLRRPHSVFQACGDLQTDLCGVQVVQSCGQGLYAVLDLLEADRLLRAVPLDNRQLVSGHGLGKEVDERKDGTPREEF